MRNWNINYIIKLKFNNNMKVGKMEKLWPLAVCVNDKNHSLYFIFESSNLYRFHLSKRFGRQTNVLTVINTHKINIFHSKINVCHETHKTTGTESLLSQHNNQLPLRVTVLLCKRNVCACLSSICGGICFIFSLSLCLCLSVCVSVSQMLFLSEHTRRVSEVAYFCMDGSANIR